MTMTTSRSTIRLRQDLSFSGILSSEWIKLRSSRSTWWVYAILFGITVGIAVQMSTSLSFRGAEVIVTADASQSLAVYALTVSADAGALVVGVLGVLVISGEYSTGMVRSTFITVPKRVPALFAKAIVFAVTSFVASMLMFATAVPISTLLLSRNDVAVRLDDPQYWLALIGAAGYIALIGLIAFSIGAIMRTTAGGIAVTFAFLIGTPLLLRVATGLSHQVWVENAAMLLPSPAGSLTFNYPALQSWVNPGESVDRSGWITESWQGGIVLLCWVIVFFIAAVIQFKKRDA